MDSGLHFFDVDYTITKRSTGLSFLYQGIKMGFLPVTPLITAPLLYWRYRLGHMDPRSVKQEIPSIAGLKRSELEVIAQRCFEERIRGQVFPQAESCIRAIQSQGGGVVFATLSVDIIVRPLADYLGVRDAIASSLEFSGDKCTGRFDGGPIFNLQKRDQVLSYIEKNGRRPEDCTFYSDSINDLPLLESIGTPIAVNPDRSLAKIAAQRGWETFRWR